MPALQIHPERNGFSCSYDAAWQWVAHSGSPAQAYGEPFPDNLWILNMAIEVYECKRSRAYRYADALRQWLRDYGMIVEMPKDGGVVVKW